MQKNRKIQKNKLLFIATLVAMLFVCLSYFGITYAKFIVRQNSSSSNEVLPYHLSSNYLMTENATYNVIDTGDGVEFKIYNYEIENASLISKQDISYTIEISSGWNLAVYDKAENTLQGSSYTLNTLESGEGNYHTIKLSASGNQKEVSVSLTTTSPFEETISATFNLVLNTTPQYEIIDSTDYVTIRIETNDYIGNINLSWNNATLVPDNTNEFMEEWQNDDGSEVLNVNAHSTYELVFLKTVSSSYTGSGSGTSITIGGV